MDKIIFLLLFPFVLGFSQIKSLEKSALTTCSIDSNIYTTLLGKRNVKFEDIKQSEYSSGLNIIDIRKRTIYTNDKNDVFLVFKIFTFPGINASRYTFHENYLSIDDAKELLVELLKIDEEFKKNEIKPEITYFNHYINTPSFVRFGLEHSYINVKTITGSVKYDYNGDPVLEKKKVWFMDIDTSCKDNRTHLIIEDFNQFIEILRNTINA